jgi:hypothetical protein
MERLFTFFVLLLQSVLAAVVLRNNAYPFPEASTGRYLDLLKKCDPHPQDELLLTVHFHVPVFKDTVLTVCFKALSARSVAVLRIRIRRIRMFFGLLDPDPIVQGTDPDPSIIKQKNSKKNTNSYCFVTSL